MPTAKQDLGNDAAEQEFLKLFCQGLLCSAEVRYLH